MTYKMIVLDLDDTLLKNDHTISPKTKQALMEAQQKGVKVVLASGRATYAMEKYRKELQLLENESYILSYNGAKIINCKTNEELFSSGLVPDIVRNLYDVSCRENVYIHTYVGDSIVTAKPNQYNEKESRITGLPLIHEENFVQAIQEPVVKVVMMEDPEKLVLVEQTLKEELSEHLSITRTKPYFLEFIEYGVTKGSSISKLIDLLGIKREEVIAIGDSYNDLEMIEFAGLGVAMGNAPDEIKQKADFVTESNENEGVAYVIDRFILKKHSYYN
ncbi:Cof-type HAD-IIB family hydrolase [Evansella sp. AB-rgal1]|uniref:Cof-type HAD-IIB family hydrolase n=1 Tax=Evansella sp. AB-rgal1 TaxID=3242696 RepID=UPI00359DA8AB